MSDAPIGSREWWLERLRPTPDWIARVFATEKPPPPPIPWHAGRPKPRDNEPA